MNDTRQQFEEWFEAEMKMEGESNSFEMSPWVEDAYKDRRVQGAWRGWEAAQSEAEAVFNSLPQ